MILTLDQGAADARSSLGLVETYGVRAAPRARGLTVVELVARNAHVVVLVPRLGMEGLDDVACLRANAAKLAAITGDKVVVMLPFVQDECATENALQVAAAVRSDLKTHGQSPPTSGFALYLDPRQSEGGSAKVTGLMKRLPRLDERNLDVLAQAWRAAADKLGDPGSESAQRDGAFFRAVHGDLLPAGVDYTLAISRAISVVDAVKRWLTPIWSTASNAQLPPAPPALRRRVVLFAAANPPGTDWLRLDKECEDIRAELQRTAAREVYRLESRWAVTASSLQAHLADPELDPTVLHFSGHGGAGDGLFVEGGSGSADVLDGRRLAAMIAAAGSRVRVVLLNACYSAELATALRPAVPCVIGMSGKVRSSSARAFAVAFYRALGAQASIAVAFRQASAALAGTTDEQLPRCDPPDCELDGLVLVP